MPEVLRLTYGKTEDGRMLAIITRGGHPQLGSPEMCEVLTVEVVRNPKAAKEWFRRMKIERPWETRQ